MSPDEKRAELLVEYQKHVSHLREVRERAAEDAKRAEESAATLKAVEGEVKQLVEALFALDAVTDIVRPTCNRSHYDDQYLRMGQAIQQGVAGRGLQR